MKDGHCDFPGNSFWFGCPQHLISTMQTKLETDSLGKIGPKAERKWHMARKEFRDLSRKQVKQRAAVFPDVSLNSGSLQTAYFGTVPCSAAEQDNSSLINPVCWEELQSSRVLSLILSFCCCPGTVFHGTSTWTMNRHCRWTGSAQGDNITCSFCLSHWSLSDSWQGSVQD